MTEQLFPNLPFVWFVFREEKSFCWPRDLIHCNMKLAAALKSCKPIHRKLEATTFRQFPTSLSPMPACPLWWHPVATLLKGLPLPLGWLLEIVANSVCLGCLGFLWWPSTARLKFLGCTRKGIFRATEISAINYILQSGVNGQYVEIYYKLYLTFIEISSSSMYWGLF